jgi:ATP phosphoribosyltransferase
MGTLRVAIPSEGALEAPTLELLASCGLAVDRANPRRYTAEIPASPGVEVLFQRSSDITQEVDGESADIGITGLDRYLEYRREGGDSILIYEDLAFGQASLVLAVPEGWLDVTTLADLADLALEFRENGRELRVATKYPRLVRRFLHRHGINYFTLVHAGGGLEAAPVMGYADLIADITASGTTLRENRLRPLRDGLVIASQAAMIGNGGLLGGEPGKLALVRGLLERIEATLRARGFQRVTANIQGESSDAVAQRVMSKRHLAGMQGPTISDVYSDDGRRWFQVQVVVKRTDLIDVVGHFRELGGSGLTVNDAAYVFRARCDAYEALVSNLRERGWLTTGGPAAP